MLAAPYDAREVSNYVLKEGVKSEIPLTQMSLLKIIFYAHGWYLAVNDRPLFRQPVEAWEHGPVVKVVRDAFKEFGKRPITKLAERLDLATGEIVKVPAELAPNDEEFVSSIFLIYGEKGAFTLSDMTHEPDGPWDRVWNAKTAIGSLGLRIKNQDIREYFLNLKLRGGLH